jgi:hypothetical protein
MRSGTIRDKLSPEGQAILARHGFSAPTMPAG